MSSITRRRFVQGAAGVAGALTVSGGLRYMIETPSAQAGVVAGKELFYRTGHSNNCDGACGHLVTVVNGKVRMIQGAPWGTETISGQPAPAYPPRSCLRGIAQIQNTYSAERVKYPYQRVGERGSGRWRRISWDDATSLIAENFERIQARYGTKSVWIAPYTGSLGLLEGVVGASFRFASAIGASAGDFEGDSEGDASTPAGWNYVLADPDLTAGGIFDGHEMTDFLNAKAIVLWANNVAETSIPDWRIMADAHKAGTPIVSIDPRFTPTSAKADIWLPIRPGTDTALIDGVMNYVLARKLYDAAYLKAYTVAPFLVDPSTKLFLRHRQVLSRHRRRGWAAQADRARQGPRPVRLPRRRRIGAHPAGQRDGAVHAAEGRRDDRPGARTGRAAGRAVDRDARSPCGPDSRCRTGTEVT